MGILMGTMWWRFLLVGAAALVVLSLGLLEIAADRATVSHYSTAPVQKTQEPEQPWVP